MRTSESSSVLQVAFEPEIGHHRADHAGLREPAVVAPALGDHREQLIAVDDVAALVGDHDAVGVAVERDADVGAHLAHLAASALRARSSRSRG